MTPLNPPGPSPADTARLVSIDAGDVPASGRISVPSSLPDTRKRCALPAGDMLFLRYHDDEWGRPVADDDALMQALGLVNDHVDGCCVRGTVESERTAFKRPAQEYS